MGEWKPLEGVRVTELGDGVPVSFAGFLLRELGAQVDKYGALREKDCDMFAVLNRGKTLHEAPPTTDEVLAVEATAIISGPDWDDCVLRSWDSLASHGIIWSRIVRDVAEMPELMSPIDSILAEASSGLMYLQQGHRDGPFCFNSPVGGYGSGLVAALSAATGLMRSRRGRKDGWRAETSYLYGALAVQTFSACFLGEPEPARTRYTDPYSVAYTPLLRFYHISNGWVFISATTQVQWVRMCALIGREDFLAVEELSGMPLNIFDQAAGQMVAQAIEEFVREMTVDECLKVFSKAGLIVAPVLTYQEFMHHPQATENGLLTTVDHPSGREQHQISNLMRFTPAEADSHSTLPPLPSAATPPFDGVRVLDLSRFVAAPMAGKIMADLGADVVKVEPLDGDPMRAVGLTFSTTNRGKRSLGLDLGKPEAQPVLRRLIEAADVVITNALPDVAKRLGQDYAALSAINPGIIQLNFLSYGARGPFTGRPVIDAAAQALVGSSLAQGGGQEPVGFGGGIVDNGGGWLGTTAIASALFARQTTGRGCYIETGLLNTAVLLQIANYVDPEIGRGRKLDPERLGYGPFHRLYRTADSWICVSASEGPQRDALSRASAADPDALEVVFATQSTADLAEQFWDMGFVNWTEVRRLEQVARAPETPFAEVEQAPWGTVRQVPRLPIVPGMHSMPLRGSPPGPGSDNDYVLRSIGFTEDDIARLVDQGVVLREPPPMMGNPLTV